MKLLLLRITRAVAILLGCLSSSGHGRRLYAKVDQEQNSHQLRDSGLSRPPKPQLDELSLLLTSFRNRGATRIPTRHTRIETPKNNRLSRQRVTEWLTTRQGNVATWLSSGQRRPQLVVAGTAIILALNRIRRRARRGVDDTLARIVRTRTGFHSQLFQEVEPQESRPGENSTFCVQQVQGKGDCLFHSIAIGIAFEDEKCHIDMNDPKLTKRVRDLRLLAVDTLDTDPNRMLHMEGDESISTGELVEAAAEQFNMTAEQYCNWMRDDGVWGGGPEILALVNALERPIHVFEPIPVNDGKEMQLQLCGAFGSPKFDNRRRICICAADDRFPNCKPVEVKRHGEGGGHFLSLLPTHGRCLPELAKDGR